MAIYRLLICLSVSCLLIGCGHTSKNTRDRYDAIVKPQSHNSKHVFSTIQAALNAAPQQSNKPFRIFIKAGNYYEKLLITKPNIYLVGEQADKTRIYYDSYAGKLTPKGIKTGTPGSAVLTIASNNIHIQHLTIENTFNYLANDALPNTSVKRKSDAQAVALFLDKNADKFKLSDSRLLGYQDTLFINDGRSWFNKVLIAGNVDFIFGKGNAVFTDSEIKTLARGKSNFPHGYIVAPSTQITNPYGFTFINCKLTRETSVPNNSVPLGRPWHPTTQFADGRYADPNAIGKAVFINTWMDEHIFVDGWYSMNGNAIDGKKIPFYPEDSRFFEYKSKGPGAQINYKRRQLTNAEVKNYSPEKILGDWIHQD